MHETEGVIKYHLHHQTSIADPAWNIAIINTWRTLLYQLKLIGQQADRYMGYSYGNISQRYINGEFIISGTQTGSIAELSIDNYCLVKVSDLDANSLCSIGPCKPSSEALSHASVYAQDKTIQCIIHAHSTEIWQATESLKLAHTPKEVAYGTPEMAYAVNTLFNSGKIQKHTLFTMLGHEDGVISFADNFPQAAFTMINTLAEARQLN